MSQELKRGILLHEQGRSKEAVGELLLALANDPSEGTALYYLIECFLDLQKYDDAEKHARELIALKPDHSIAYYSLARVLRRRNRLEEARSAINRAILLDPEDADNFGMKGAIELSDSQWKEALSAADTGLEIDPENHLCINVRARALVQSNDVEKASEALQDALSQRPESAYLHANQGWVLLRKGLPDDARIHFREALRLDPEDEYARSGLLEAIKAKNFVYRWVLKYVFFVGSLTQNQKWYLVVGLYILAKVLRSLGKTYPSFQPYVTPFTMAYMVFAVVTWIAYPLSNLFLFLHPTGRLCLSRDDRRGAMLLAAIFLMAIVAGALGLVTGSRQLMIVGSLYIGLASLPASAVFQLPEGWPRYTLLAIVCMALLTAVFVAVPLDWIFANPPDAITKTQLFAYNSFGILIFLITIATNYLSQTRVTR